MITVLRDGTRKARKPHQCYHCYRSIGVGNVHGFQTNVYDGAVYTLRWHPDCDACAADYRKQAGTQFDYDEGFQPMRDDWVDSGEYEFECNYWRGRYPHVVARMELTDQLRNRTP
jgi:hypothetical protein